MKDSPAITLIETEENLLCKNLVDGLSSARNIEISRHAVDRFIERVRPDLGTTRAKEMIYKTLTASLKNELYHHQTVGGICSLPRHDSEGFGSLLVVVKQPTKLAFLEYIACVRPKAEKDTTSYVVSSVWLHNKLLDAVAPFAQRLAELYDQLPLMSRSALSNIIERNKDLMAEVDALRAEAAIARETKKELND